MELLEVAQGALGWSPEMFWNASPIEFGAALAGKIRYAWSTGDIENDYLDDEGNPLPAGMTRSKIKDLARLQEELEREEAEAQAA